MCGSVGSGEEAELYFAGATVVADGETSFKGSVSVLGGAPGFFRRLAKQHRAAGESFGVRGVD
jgi:hypothetical protein